MDYLKQQKKIKLRKTCIRDCTRMQDDSQNVRNEKYAKNVELFNKN